jgi:hypothetical protein
LVVGLVSDVDVISYKRAPVMTYAERVAVVQGCRHVDKVVDAPARVLHAGRSYRRESRMSWRRLPASGDFPLVCRPHSFRPGAGCPVHQKHFNEHIIERIHKSVHEGGLA